MYADISFDDMKKCGYPLGRPHEGHGDLVKQLRDALKEPRDEWRRRISFWITILAGVVGVLTLACSEDSRRIVIALWNAVVQRPDKTGGAGGPNLVPQFKNTSEVNNE